MAIFVLARLWNLLAQKPTTCLVTTSDMNEIIFIMAARAKEPQSTVGFLT